jgi:RimJ/RimL family protein N-acetyltransferase
MATNVKSSPLTYPSTLKIEERSDIYLRLIDRGDVPELYEVMINNRQHLEQHLQTGDLTKKGVEDGVEWMLKHIQDGSYLQYRLIVGEKIIGSALLYDIDRKNGTAKTGIWVEKKSEGKGYAGAAMKRLMNYGFEELGLEKIVFDIDPNNTRSEKLAQRLGARLAKGDILTETFEDGRKFTYRIWEAKRV